MLMYHTQIGCNVESALSAQIVKRRGSCHFWLENSENFSMPHLLVVHTLLKPLISVTFQKIFAAMSTVSTQVNREATAAPRVLYTGSTSVLSSEWLRVIGGGLFLVFVRLGCP